MTRLSFPAAPTLALALTLALMTTSCGIVRGNLTESPPEPVEEGAVEAVEEETEEETDTETGNAADALPYFEAFAKISDADAVEAGTIHAQPDSPAHGYLRYQADASRAVIASGQSYTDYPVELKDDDTIEFCSTGCIIFDEFVFVDGLLFDFAVDGNLVSDNFHPGGDTAEDEGVSGRVTSTYYAASTDALVVIVDIETEDAPVQVTDALYQGEDGAGPLDEQFGITGPEWFDIDDPGQVMLQFPAQRAPGTVELSLECDEECQALLELSVG